MHLSIQINKNTHKLRWGISLKNSVVGILTDWIISSTKLFISVFSCDISTIFSWPVAWHKLAICALLFDSSVTIDIDLLWYRFLHSMHRRVECAVWHRAFASCNACRYKEIKKFFYCGLSLYLRRLYQEQECKKCLPKHHSIHVSVVVACWRIHHLRWITWQLQHMHLWNHCRRWYWLLWSSVEVCRQLKCAVSLSV